MTEITEPPDSVTYEQVQSALHSLGIPTASLLDVFMNADGIRLTYSPATEANGYRHKMADRWDGLRCTSVAIER